MPRSHILCALLLGAFLAALPAPAAGTPLSLQLAGEIRAVLERPAAPQVVLGRTVLLNSETLPDFYRQRAYAPAWFDDLGLTAVAREFLEVLRGAAEEGLCPEDYHLRRLEPLFRLEGDSRPYGILFDPGYMARLDLLLSDAFFLFAAHLLEGRVDPAAVHEGWRARPRRVDLSALLGAALEGEPLPASLASLAPPHPGYRRLRAALAGYRRVAALGAWPAVPAGETLRPGESDARLPLLRRRLAASGDLEGGGEGGELFDAAVEAALRRFQARHGLDADGVLGAKTLAALNVPVEERIRQIEYNLERWRWLPREMGRRHLAINIADFSLQVVEDDRPVMAMPVVVGTAYRKTPVFSARMTYLEFAPYWSVPPTILREDKLPLIRKDPGWLKRHHYEIVRQTGSGEVVIDPATVNWRRVTARTFPGTLRQKPGPWNPLGRVKFMFPNRFAVYLHDTPERHLFAREVRTFSSGCIRIERPLDLAQYLLEGKAGWDCERIEAAMASRRPLQVGLPEPLPVHVLYWTAWVDEAGDLNFRRDLYLRDLDLERALAGDAGKGEGALSE